MKHEDFFFDLWVCSRFICLILLAGNISAGCSSIDYYSQTVSGHLDLMGRREPVAQLIDDQATAPALRAKLQQLQQIRDFASSDLLLPDNGSYRSYAAIDRQAVVWSVVAAEEFAVEPVNWCYPVVGCASYRGYFSLADARSYSDKLAEKGLDVAVLPVAAYSTLGWFDDPVPSSVIGWEEARLAGLLFHELAHQMVYVPGDSAFNEGFATAVQREGVQRWFEHLGDGAAISNWRRQQQREQQFVALLLQTRQRLERLYMEALPADVTRLRKRKEFGRLRQAYRQLKHQWGGYSGYDAWFRQQTNNAHLASVATYESWVPVFERLLDRQHGDMKAFYLACKKLAGMPRQQRQLLMQAILTAGSTAPAGAAGCSAGAGRGRPDTSVLWRRCR